MSDKSLVVDANILIRAVLGTRARRLIEENASTINFLAPDAAYAEARRHLPGLLSKRGAMRDAELAVLDGLESLVQSIDFSFYSPLQQPALQRISMRDADDWPVLACAMLLSCPVWTEDQDFFGTGVATWTTDRVALYFT